MICMRVVQWAVSSRKRQSARAGEALLELGDGLGHGDRLHRDVGQVEDELGPRRRADHEGGGQPLGGDAGQQVGGQVPEAPRRGRRRAAAVRRGLLDEHGEGVGRGRVGLQLEQAGQQAVALFEAGRAPRRRRPRRARAGACGDLSSTRMAAMTRNSLAVCRSKGWRAAISAMKASTRSASADVVDVDLVVRHELQQHVEGPLVDGRRDVRHHDADATGSPVGALCMAPEQDDGRRRGHAGGHPAAPRWPDGSRTMARHGQGPVRGAAER